MGIEGRSLLTGLSLTLIIVLGTTNTVNASEDMAFGPLATNGEPLWRLIYASDAVSTNLSKIKMALVDASIALSEAGVDGPDARAVLSNLTQADSAVIDCITIDVNGTVREVEPESFASVKGENLRWQKHVNDTLNIRLYLGFYFIDAVEGSYAIDSEMPVFDRNGTLIGTVSLMFNNSQFFERVLAPFQPGGNSKIWVCKADDGTILYETDPSQILLNKSSSIYQEYPEILKLADRMSAERTGYGTYGFLDQSHGEAVEKGCYWATIPNEGTEMRIVLTTQIS